MALAKPIAATPVGGIMDMIAPNLTGLFFDPDDAAGLADCVDRFARDADGARRMGLTAQDYIRRSFTPRQQIDHAMDILRRVAQEPACR
jgi:glycosyltransferase involved in cell wall biosynthesis